MSGIEESGSRSSQLHNLTPSEAEERIRKHVAAIPFLEGAIITRVPELDVAGLYAFSVLPPITRIAGEIIYLVGATDMLSSGNTKDFEELMRRLGVGATANALDVGRFADLFLRFLVLRRGEVLEAPDGHPLMRPDQLSPSEFSPPTAAFNANGARYSFWVFDVEWRKLIFFDVHVGPDGTVSFTPEGE